MRALPQVDNNTLSLITWTGNKLNDAVNKNPFMSDKSPSFQSDPIWGTVLKANGNYALCSTNQITSPITYDMWLCPLNNVSGDFGNYSYMNDSQFWSTQGYAGHENEPWFHVDANNSITFQICAAEKGTTPANTLEPNKWNLYSFEFNSSRYAIYKNGVKLVDKAAVSSTYYGGWIRLFCGASSRLNNCLVGPIRISNICRHGFKNFSIEEWQKTQQEPLPSLPKFISQIRADSSSTTGIKDLQGNIWEVFNHTKLTHSPDPFGKNDAIKIESYGGAGNFLTLKQANAIWSKEIMPNFTLASWVKLDRARDRAHIFTINDKTRGSFSCTIILRENDIGYITYGTNYPDPMVPAGSNKQWFYLEVSFEDTLMRIFKNGKLLKEATVIRRFKNFHDVYNWLGQWPWEPNYSLNGSTFHIFDFCLIEGVLHKKNYTPPRSYLSFEDLFNKVSASSNSLVIQKNDITSRVPIYSSFRWQEGNPDHKISFYIPNTGIYSAVFGNTKQCIFHRNWIDGHNNVQSSALADVFGSRNVLRFDSSKGTNSFMNLAENIGQNYSFECFFKFSDNKDSNWIVGATTVNIAVNYVNNEYNLSWYLNSQNSSVLGGNGSWYVTPNQWYHLYFQYIGGMKFKIALDGIWSEDEMTTLKPEDNTWLLIGGWDDDSRRSNKISKSVIDMSYVFVYKTNNPPYNTFQSNFSRPMHAPSVKILNGRNVEYGMAPLLQDIQKSPIYFSIAGGKYGIDPTTDLANFEKANKIFHITNENGYVYDITCKTDWTSTNITPESNLIGAPLRTCTNGQYGMLVKNSGPDIVIGLDDFTFLMDFKIYGSKNLNPPSNEVYKARYYLIGGDLNALESSISEDMKWMNLGYAGNHPGNEWATITNLNLQYGKEYRIIEQRKDGVVDVWINGRHVYQGKLLIDMSGKVKYVAAPEATASMNLNGSIRNAVLWNKAVISMPGGGGS